MKHKTNSMAGGKVQLTLGNDVVNESHVEAEGDEAAEVVDLQTRNMKNILFNS